MLALRLRELTEHGIVRRRRLLPAGVQVYELTPWGAELEPIVIGLGRWSSKSPSFDSDAPIGADSLALSLKALFDPARADTLDATISLSIDEDRLTVRIEAGRIDVTRGEAVRPDLALTADSNALAAVMWGDGAIDDGTLKIGGDLDLAARFVTLFPLPTPADDLREADA
ncbi:SCP2 sterol-binding domain-containing protein [Alloactinosynnema sp. L-07]|uniref:winged helix-turn-helix transcriptional regulator n=1 Tax=Alloactinosynnema sp. L-07 TaxID=1653480 RepID=UPI001E634F30|nr:SCP2 sterol-binding domain-containing protein [Alloactinosynnema sp. L-07]